MIDVLLPVWEAVVRHSGGSPLTAGLVALAIVSSMRNGRKIDNSKERMDDLEGDVQRSLRYLEGEEAAARQGVMARLEALTQRIEAVEDGLASTRRSLPGGGED